MTEHPFSLVPFPDPPIPDIKIQGRIAREGSLLTIHYAVSGNVEEILLPAASDTPRRKGDLWLATCFEFFLATPGRPEYWEFNLSPSGDWNAFRMDSYRRAGFRQEERVQNLPFDIRRNQGCTSLDASIDLHAIFEPQTALQVGVTSVIQAVNGRETYWALVHPRPQADFHLRESFILALEGAGRP